MHSGGPLSAGAERFEGPLGFPWPAPSATLPASVLFRALSGYRGFPLYSDSFHLVSFSVFVLHIHYTLFCDALPKSEQR